jgi:hypothetical protein
MYNFPTDFGFLTQIAPRQAHPSARPAVEYSPIAVEPGKPSAVFDVPDPAFIVLDASDTSLQDGCVPTAPHLLDPTPIFAKDGCPFLRDAKANGGKDYDNPLWNLSVLCTAFMENGNEIAQEISKGHTTYDQAETQALYDRKVIERRDRGVGYPSCAAIAGAGCKACWSCPLRNRIKSPLNLANFRQQASAPDEADKTAHQTRWVDPLDFSLVQAQEAVDRINAAGFFVLTSNGDIYHEEAGGSVVAQKTAGFSNLFACRKVIGEKVPTTADKPCRKGEKGPITADKVWLRSPSRREYAQIGYWPGGHECPAKAYNLWRGWGIQPVPGDWSIIRDHIVNVVAGADEDKTNFILDWCAHMLQRPWEKPGVALVFRGKKGTGKSILTQLIIRCIGDRNALVTANGKQLFAQFNWHLADKLLIVAEEAFFAGNHELNDRLKHFVTGEDFEAEQKFGQRVSMKSMHRLIMASNHDKVVDASEDERRFFMCEVSDEKRGDDAYFAPLVDIVKGRGEATLTLAAFMHHLQTRDISNFKPERAARSAGKRDLARQKLLGLEPPLQWLLEVALADPTSTACHGLLHDVGPPGAVDIDLDKSIKARAPSSQPVGLEWSRAEALEGYRIWMKRAQARGASEFTGAGAFWTSIKRLLNPTIFPERKLFRSSGGKRFVCIPPGSELIDGFHKLLGAKVVDVDDDDPC